MMAKQTIKTTTHNDSLDALKTTVLRREFWVGLLTTFIVLLVAVKVLPWNSIHKLTTNKTNNVMSPIPTSASQLARNESTSSAGLAANTTGSPTMTPAATATPQAVALAMAKVSPTPTDSKMAKKKVNTLADTSGYYIVEENDNYYTISVKVCGNGRYFESIQAENNYAPLYAGDQLIVSCTE